MRLVRKITLCLVFAAALFGVADLPALAVDAFGVWATSDADAHIKVGPCGDQLCAQIVWLKDPIDKDTGKASLDKNNPDPEKRKLPIVGLQLFQNMKATAANNWKGKIYNPDDGKSYDATVTFEDAKLKVKGCGLGGLICQTEIWTRSTQPL